MGQSQPTKQIALVVEDDPFQRERIVTLLEESEMDVIACGSGEAANLVLDHVGRDVATLLTTSTSDGIELAQIAHERFPALRVIVISPTRASAACLVGRSSSQNRGSRWSC